MERSKQATGYTKVGAAMEALLVAIRNGQLVRQKLIMNNLDALGVNSEQAYRELVKAK